MTSASPFTAGRGLRPLQPLEEFLRASVEQSGGVWEEVEPLVYDLLIGDDETAVRVAFDPEALPEHPSAQLASLGSPLMDRLLNDTRRRGAYTVLYATGLNTHPYDLPARFGRAYTIPTGFTLAPVGVRLCFFPQATYSFVATFVSDRKEQAALDVSLDLHSGREVRHLNMPAERLAGTPVEPLPEAPHLSVPAGFGVACGQVIRSLSPLANQRRRELQEHTGHQIDRARRYYARMLEELEQQPRRRTDEANFAARQAARVEAIRRESELRTSELRQKSVLHVTLALAGVKIIHLPKLLVKFQLVDQRQRMVAGQAVFDLWTEAFEPYQKSRSASPTFDLAAMLT